MSGTPPKSKAPNSVAAYQKTSVMTADRETLLLMMYAGAIRFLRRALEAGKKGNIPERARCLSRTQEIVGELRASLNFEVGEDVAFQLERLYDFISRRLIEGNLEKNDVPIEEALGILLNLNETWEQAIASLKSMKTNTSS